MNEKALTAVKLFEADMRERLYLQNDEDMLFADLTGLYIEIINEISKTDRSKSVIIYDYAKLLEQELQLYSGTEAYIAGQKAKGKPEKDALIGYMLKVVNENSSERLDTRIQAYFNEFIELLGDKSGLITEFTETYRMAHGVVKNNIAEFIRMGQASGAKAAVTV